MRDPKRAETATPHYGDFTDRLRGDHWQPDVDVYETESAVIVRAEIAGVRRDALRVTMDGDVLRIQGQRDAAGSEASRLHQMEIATGPFERRVRLPVAVDREKVSAHLEDGVLTVTLGRKSERRDVPVMGE
ncbi:MAG: Hsp20/alpha crystallin family protein [Myxococcota bacterium]